jgi:hypothetical protein
MTAAAQARVAGVLVLFAVALTAAAPTAHAQPLTIGAYEKVSETRVTRTVTQFTYRATLTNAGAAITGAAATATSLSAATMIVDGALTFGPVASNGSAPSLDTFTFRHDRTVPFDWTVLQWVVAPSSANTPPVADAGPDQTVPVGASVQLDGSGSSDADGDSLTFAWTLESMPPGSGASLADPTALHPTFVADLPGSYTARLIVNDGTNDSAPDLVVITTVNSAPVADAGADQSVFLGDTVALDGSGSADADGDALTYTWAFASRPAGSVAVLSDPSADDPTFVVDLPGSYVVQLVVHDGTTASPPDSVTITTGNSPPVADAGQDRAVFVAETVTLSGAGSSDPDGDPLSFSWSLTTRPAGSAATLSNTASVSPSFVADLPGTYLAQLIVNDGSADSAPDTVTITARQPLVSVVATDATASEAPVDSGLFTLSRLGPSSNDLVLFFTMSGTATEGADYGALPGSVTIPAGSSSATVSLTPIDDALFEGPETAILMLTPDPSYTVGALDQATVTITDDELPAVTIVASGDTAAEQGLVEGIFTITRTGPTVAPLAVAYAVHGGAINGVDYEALSGMATIPAGSSTTTVIITPVDDALFEGSELVILSLSAGPGYVVVVPGIAAVEILDDDGAQVSIEATDPTASEAGDTGTFTVSRTGGDLSQALLVHVLRSGTATDGVDYVDLGGISFFVTIPANELSATVTITPRPDAIVEGDETVILTILARAEYTIVGTGTATVTIIGP